MAEEWSRASTDDGQTFVYLDDGDGPLVVLFHGFPDTPHGYERIAGALVDAGYRAVRPWLRGYHPETIVEGRPYDLVTVASDPVCLLDALGERDAVLAGHDWGSAMVYGAAALHPDRVRAVVPIALPHFNFLPRDPRTLIAARHMLALHLPWAEHSVQRNDFAYLRRLYRRWAPRWTGAEPERCLARAKEAFADRRVLSGALDYYRALKPGAPSELERPSSVPAMIVADPGIGREIWERSAAIMGEGSEILWLEGAGHWPHREYEDEFIARLLDFVQRT